MGKAGRRSRSEEGTDAGKGRGTADWLIRQGSRGGLWAAAATRSDTVYPGEDERALRLHLHAQPARTPGRAALELEPRAFCFAHLLRWLSPSALA